MRYDDFMIYRTKSEETFISHSISVLDAPAELIAYCRAEPEAKQPQVYSPKINANAATIHRKEFASVPSEKALGRWPLSPRV